MSDDDKALVTQDDPKPDVPATEQPSIEAHDPDQAYIEASRAPLMEHLIELRSRLIVMVVAFLVCFLASFVFSGDIFLALTHPFEMASRLLEAQKVAGHKAGPFDLIEVLLGLKAAPAAAGGLKLIYTEALELFFTKVKVAMFGGIVLSFPIMAWQLYRFVAPGLYKKERAAFAPFLLAAPVLFCMGAALVYFLILPMVMWFSLSQQIVSDTGVSVQLLPKVSEYLSLVTTLILAFGLCFQLPIVISLLGMTGMVDSRMLSSFRRYAILAIVGIAAVVTPPDPISQIMLSIPLVLLYEVSILCMRVIEFRRKGAKHP
jgi:sec-independent protein translocase protein TatC